MQNPKSGFRKTDPHRTPYTEVRIFLVKAPFLGLRNRMKIFPMSLLSVLSELPTTLSKP